MSPHSTAKYVSYDLRPSKQIERKMMLDSFGAAMESGFPISEYRYVGMGGTRFYDFILIHKFLGIEKMTSLEHDRKLMQRVMYNVPYKFIEVVNTDVHDFIARDVFSGNTIYWMDYDGVISPNITRDIASLAPRMKPRDFVFFTVCGALPQWLKKMNTTDRLVEMKERFIDLAMSLKREDMEDEYFPATVLKLLRAAFKNAFVFRRDGVFRPFFQVSYKDGQEMLTFGGVFARVEEWRYFAKALKNKGPVLERSRAGRYKIEKFNLTERERILFDRAATGRPANTEELKEIRQLGFKVEKLRKYRELLRYHPRYVETLL